MSLYPEFDPFIAELQTEIDVRCTSTRKSLEISLKMCKSIPEPDFKKKEEMIKCMKQMGYLSVMMDLLHEQEELRNKLTKDEFEIEVHKAQSSKSGEPEPETKGEGPCQAASD